MKIQYLGHACFKLVSGDYEIIVDPYSKGSVPGLCDLDEVADECLCSHGHGDHHGVDCVKLRGTAEESPFAVTKLESWHDDKQGTMRGSNIIHVFEADGVKAVHMGDIGCMPAEELIEKMKDADALMIPVGGHYTAEPEVIREMVRKIDPAVTILMHYRSEKSGFDVIKTWEAYASLCSEVVHADSDTMTVEKTEKKDQTVILRQKMWK